MVTHKEAIAAIKLVDEYCDGRECENCVFNGVICPYGFRPKEWKQIMQNLECLEKEQCNANT